MRFSPWTQRAVIAVLCVWTGPRLAAGFPWRLPTRQGPTTARPAPRRGTTDGKDSDGSPTITAVGDQLVIRGDDPQKVALAYQLARMILSDKGQTYKTFRLKYASADELAQILTEWFNGPPQKTIVTNPVAALMMIRGGRGVRPTPPPPPPPPPRGHIVSEPATNSLIVRAGTLDLITIERLIDTAFDVEPTESNASSRPFIIGPLKYAMATEIVRLLKQVYREDTNQTRGLSGRGRPRPQPLDPSGRPKPVTLSISADDRTNTIVGMAPEGMADGLRKLVAVIEEKAKTDTKVVELVPAQGIDPALVQQVIDAIQARPATTPTPSRTNPMTPGNRSPFNGGR